MAQLCSNTGRSRGHWCHPGGRHPRVTMGRYHFFCHSWVLFLPAITSGYHRQRFTSLESSLSLLSPAKRLALREVEIEVAVEA